MNIDIEYRPINELKPNDKNPRKITRAELNKLKRSIKEFGFIDPVIVNKHPDRNNIIIGGHQRIDAAKSLGMKSVPVVYVNVPEDKEHLLNMALNEISGAWDEDKLYNLLKELSNKPGVDMTLSGFDEAFIDEILSREIEGEKEKLIDVVPSPPKNPKSRRGDIYKLGSHRLMCGDSTNPEDVAKLMGDAIADCAWTDPPYGVSYSGDNNPNGRDWGVMTNDELRGDKLYEFLLPAYKNMARHTKDNAALYTCYASINHMIFERALNIAGFVVKQQIIWSKGHILGHSDYHWSHEPILYCTKKDRNSEWTGDRCQKTIILTEEIKELEEHTKEELMDLIKKIREDSDLINMQRDPVQEYIHPTQKPVALSRRMFKNNTRPTDKVLDLFAGSGSTLMACETCKREAYCMEIDPAYVDCAINRWEQYTGKKAELIVKGKE